MNEYNNKIILFSRDESLAGSINLTQIGNQDLVSRKIVIKAETVLTSDLISTGSVAVVYDLDLVDNDMSLAAVDILKLKNADIGRPLILIGTKPSLDKALNIERIEALVARSVSKPNATNELFMAIGSVSKTTKSKVEPQKKSNTGKYGLIASAICIAAIGLFLVLSDKREPSSTLVNIKSEINQTETENRELNATSINTQKPTGSTEIAQLKILASQAYDAGRVTSPKGDNALEYYNRILAIDEYDVDAYSGKSDIFKALRASFPQLLEKGEFDDAKQVVSILKQADSLNSSNSDLQERLELAISVSESAKIEVAAEVLSEATQPANVERQLVVVEKVDEESANRVKEQEREQQAKFEQDVTNKILASIDSGNLTPPQSNNAYELLLVATQQNNIQKSVLLPSKAKLENQLVARAQQALTDKNVGSAENDIQFIRNLDPDNQVLQRLTTSLIETRDQLKAVPKTQTSLIQSKTNAVMVSDEDVNEPEKFTIIPFEIINKAEPIYPRRAYQLDVEGWVELEYQIDEVGQPININVVAAEPNNIFDKAGIDVIERSQFSPAKNSLTGETMISEVSTIRFNFSIGR